MTADSGAAFLSERFDLEPPSNIDHIERSFCTNFWCCNVHLSDLHALFAHYDAKHLPDVLSSKYLPQPTLDYASDGYDSSATTPSPSTPSPMSFADDPSTSELFNKPSLPFPPSPNSQHAFPFDADINHPDYPDYHLFDDYPTHEQCYRVAAVHVGSTAPSPPSFEFSPPSSPALRTPVANALDSIPPYGMTGESCHLVCPSSPLLPQMEVEDEAEASGFTLPDTAHSLSTLNCVDPTSLLSTSSTLRRSNPSSSGTGTPPCPKKARIGGNERGGGGAKCFGRRKERVYNCPTSGCTKVYLNPNGLKYHQEKGRCKIECDALRAEITNATSVSSLNLKVKSSPIISESSGILESRNLLSLNLLNTTSSVVDISKDSLLSKTLDIFSNSSSVMQATSSQSDADDQSKFSREKDPPSSLLSVMSPSSPPSVVDSTDAAVPYSLQIAKFPDVQSQEPIHNKNLQKQCPEVRSSGSASTPIAVTSTPNIMPPHLQHLAPNFHMNPYIAYTHSKAAALSFAHHLGLHAFPWPLAQSKRSHADKTEKDPVPPQQHHHRSSTLNTGNETLMQQELAQTSEVDAQKTEM